MNYQKLFCLSVLSAVLLAIGLVTQPVLASEAIVVRYGIFEESFSVAELRSYAETQSVSSGMRDILRFLSQAEQVELQEFLNASFPVDLVAVDRVLNRAPGTEFLAQAATATAREIGRAHV
jgi:hypothetical protein